MTVPLRIAEIQQSGVNPEQTLADFLADPAQMKRLAYSESVMFAGAGDINQSSAGAVVTVLALLAFAPGGVKTCGLHFDAAQGWFYCRRCDAPYWRLSTALEA